jgi:TonB family protein
MEVTGLDGRAELLFVVQTDGSVENSQVRSASHPTFGYAALEVIESWQFKPGMRDGQIVPMRVAQPFVFIAGPVRKANALLGREVFNQIEEVVFSPFEVGGSPEIVYEPVPHYPKKLLGSGRSEVFYVIMAVGPDGRGYNIEIEGFPPKKFICPAFKAASSCCFRPMVHNGEPVYVYTRVEIVISEDIGRLRRRGRDVTVGDPDDRYQDYPDF